MNPHGMPPARRMVPVVIAVSALHALALRVAPDMIVAPGTKAAPAFSTRQIALAAPPPPQQQEAPRAPARAAARPEPRQAPQPPAPAPPQPAAPEAAPPAPAPELAPPPAGRQSDTAHAHMAPVAQGPEAPVMSGTQAHAALIPAPVRMHYEVEMRRGPLSVKGHAQLHWRHDGNKYDARLEVGAPFLPSRVQTSSGAVTREGLLPFRFSDRSRTEEATHFDREKGKLTFSSNRPEAALLAGAQDRLSVVIQLSAMVGGDPSKFPVGTSISVPTAGTRESDTWVFTVEGEEDLSLPGGDMKGLKLQRLPRREYDTKVELWLAPRLDYAPVRLRLTSPNGDSVDQRWASADKG